MRHDPRPGFGDRLSAVFTAWGQLCVGIDPHAALLEAWGLPDSAAGAREFGLRVVEASVDRAGIVKPQIAFYERHGAAGYAALEEVLAAARAAGLLVIADVKRGDLGTSVDAYADAWLMPGSPLEADAMTVVAYQGLGSLDGVIDRAERFGKGLFVLAATSNPEAKLTQTARRADGLSVAAGVVADVAARNAGLSTAALGSVGVVVGATIALSEFGIGTEALSGMPVLAPGFGHQGARIAQLPELFGSEAQNVLVSASRSILSAGPAGLAGAIDAHVAEVAACRA
ncbi:orotidine-5'-phosphate decarboxylase [Lysinimonas soli]|uniref:Orotidine-5'-phosphate decarboxylase n=1 Tax=Lysinimonas soli TaxID=1074233 RepID=A0ABW0NM83_9MICO